MFLVSLIASSLDANLVSASLTANVPAISHLTMVVGQSSTINTVISGGIGSYSGEWSWTSTTALNNQVVNTLSVGNQPDHITINPQGTLAYVSNFGSGTVSVINLATNTVANTITVENGPQGIAFNPSGTFAYVTNLCGTGSSCGYETSTEPGTVSIINVATNTVVNTVTVGGEPFGVTVNPQGTLAYVLNSCNPAPPCSAQNGTISVINLATNAITNTIQMGTSLTTAAFSPNGMLAYVVSYCNITCTNYQGKLSTINVATNTVVNTITLGNGASGISINPSGTLAYVVNNCGNVPCNTSLEFDTVSVVNLVTDTVIDNISDIGGDVYFSAFNPSGTLAFVPVGGDVGGPTNTISVINVATNTIFETITIPGGPLGNRMVENAGVAVNPSGSLAYVTNWGSGTVSSFNIPETTLQPLPANGLLQLTVNAISSNSISFASNGNTYTEVLPQGQTIYGHYDIYGFVNDSSHIGTIPQNTIVVSNTVTIDSPLSSNAISLSVSNATLNGQQYLNITAYVNSANGGSSPYTYNFVISNSITNTVITSQKYAGIQASTDSFIWQVPNSDAGNVIQANVIITDSEQTPVTANSIYSPTITLNPQFQNTGWTASLPSVDIGQTETLTSTVSGGTRSIISAQFNGASSNIQIPPLSEISGGSSVTISSWVYLSNLNNNQIILSDDWSSPEGLQVYVHTNGELEADFGSGGISWTVVGTTPTGTIGIGKWYNIVETWTSGSGISIYVNGIPQTVSYAIGNSFTTGTLDTSSTGNIGYNLQGSGGYFQGSMANFQIYNASLSATAVNALYAEGITGAPVTFNSLVAWWDLDGTVRDYSHNQNNGVPTAITYTTSNNALTYNDLIYAANGLLVDSLLASNLSTTTNSFSFSTLGLAAGTYTANTIDHDSATTYNTVVNSITFTVNPEQSLSFNSFASDPTLPDTLDVGQTISLTASINGGVSDYIYNFTISNSITNRVLTSQTYTTGSTTNTTTWAIPQSVLGNTIEANVIVTDSANSVINSTYLKTLTVNPAPVTVPPNVIDYLPIVLTNYQSTAVATSTQVAIGTSSTGNIIGFNALAYKSYYTSNVNNAEFFFANGTIVKSWLEGNILSETQNTNLYTSENLLYSVLIPTNTFLPANTGTPISDTIYLGWAGNILSSANDLMNGISTGEAPQLSQNYGSADNGNSVFTFYDNFTGNSLNTGTKWTVLNSAGSYTVNNGITMVGGGSGAWETVGSKNNFNPQTQIGEGLMYINGNGLSGGTVGLGFGGIAVPEYWITTGTSSPYYYGLYLYGGSATSFTATTIPASSTYQVASIWTTPSMGLGEINYANQVSSSTDFSASTSIYLSIQNTLTSLPIHIQWIRIRILPPNGVMPIATLGTVQASYTNLTVLISSASNAIVDQGQSESFNGAISGGASPYNVFLHVANSATPGTMVYNTNATFSGSSWSFNSIPVQANWVTDSPLIANVVVTDANALTTNSVYTSTFIANAPQSAGTMTESNTIIGAGQYSRLTANPSGGTSPYTIDYFAEADCAGSSIGTGASVLVSPSYTTTYSYNSVDSATTPNSICSASNTITVNSAPSITISNPANTLADQNQYESFNGVISGGQSPYNVFLYVVNSVTYGTVVYSANTFFSGTSWSFNGIQIPANWVTNSLLVANVVMTDASSATVNSIYTGNFAANSIQATGVLTETNTVIDLGQSSKLTASATGGTPGYSFNWFVLPNCQVPSVATGATYTQAITSTTTFSFNSIDSATSPNSICSASNTVTVNPSPSVSTFTSFPVLPNSLETGETIMLTANVNGGSSPYTYNFIISNSLTSTILASQASSMSSTSNTFAFTIPSSMLGNTLEANVVITDSATTPIILNSTYLAAITLTQGMDVVISPSTTQTISSGQSVQFNSEVSGGTPTYHYQWLSGSSSTCASDGQITGATSNTYSASISATTYYCLEVTDSAHIPETVYSTSSEVVVQNSGGTTQPASNGGSGGAVQSQGPKGAGNQGTTGTNSEKLNFSVVTPNQEKGGSQGRNASHLTITGINLTVAQYSLSSNSAKVTINDRQYTLNQSEVYDLNQSQNESYLLAVSLYYPSLSQTGGSGIPSLKIGTFMVPEEANFTAQNLSIGILSNQTAKTLNLLRNGISIRVASVARGYEFLKAVNLTNDSTLPKLPNGYSRLSVENVSLTDAFATNMANATMNITFTYGCGIPYGQITPFILDNGFWAKISAFTVNPADCSVSVKESSDPVIAIARYNEPQNVTIPNQQTNQSLNQSKPNSDMTTTAPPKPESQNDLWYYLMLAAGAAIILAAAYAILRKKNGRPFLSKAR